jgi:hypothetical protein
MRATKKGGDIAGQVKPCCVYNRFPAHTLTL